MELLEVIVKDIKEESQLVRRARETDALYEALDLSLVEMVGQALERHLPPVKKGYRQPSQDDLHSDVASEKI